MATLRTDHSWTVELSTVELRLVLKSLGGRLGSEEERDEARQLGDQLTRLRARCLQQDASTADQLSRALET